MTYWGGLGHEYGGKMDHPIGEVGVDMDKNKEWHKTHDMVENLGEDKTLVDMC